MGDPFLSAPPSEWLSEWLILKSCLFLHILETQQIRTLKVFTV